MQWTKLGRILETPCDLGWMYCHGATLPIVHPRRDGGHRLYFGSRDDRGRTLTACVDDDVDRQWSIDNTFQGAVVGLGVLGAFDDNGVSPASIVTRDDKMYFYYSGWSLGVTVPFYLAIGLAISEDDGRTFTRHSIAPIVDRNPTDPIFSSTPFVLIDNGIWRMWYVSCDRWEAADPSAKHYYHIRYAESNDGIAWQPTGRVCIDFKSADEYAIARPWVVKDNDMYRMWYCSRGDVYRMGYAESKDGLDWERRDEAVGLTMSDEGWDSEMLAYPSVFDHAGRRYLLYNGNGYGRSGFGVAVRDLDSPNP
jgi:hypothetical protein